jgi:hypothetical protein
MRRGGDLESGEDHLAGRRRLSVTAASPVQRDESGSGHADC